MCSPKIKLIVLNDLFFKSEVYFATQACREPVITSQSIASVEISLFAVNFSSFVSDLT